jgi:phytoene/squalene synthetase
MLVLEKIEAQDYNVLRRRPSVTKAERAWLLLGALGRRVFPRPE